MRKPLLLLLVLAAVVGTAPNAEAAPRGMRYADVLRATRTTISIPPEWDGIWASEDSVYDCQGVLQSVEVYLDTLCAGQVYGYQGEDPTGGLLTITCTGFATATVASVTCAGSGEIIPDCTVSISNSLDATRTGNSFVAVSITDISASGTALGCNLFPARCTRVVTHATRTGPAPADYCLTPTRPSSWGEVRIRYR